MEKKRPPCLNKLVEAIDHNLKEDSKEVQNLMREYFKIVGALYSMSKKQWLNMGVSIGENKEMYLLYAKMHPKLPEFLAKAIKIYGENLGKKNFS